MAKVYLGQACYDENKKYSGGKSGDQTGKEVAITEYYKYSGGWNCVIRFKDANIREKLVKAMRDACRNDNIGYSQSTRNTILTYAKKVGYDLSKIKDKCNCDCSSLVSVCCMYGGVKESVLYKNKNCATTSTLKNLLKSTGLVDVFTNSAIVGSSAKLVRGDIILKEGHHVAIFLGNEVVSVEPIKEDVKKEETKKVGTIITMKESFKVASSSTNAKNKKYSAIYEKGVYTIAKKDSKTGALLLTNSNHKSGGWYL